mmetsp:Transcript_2489/g.5464  ORF Transcript_2489/g.5464 Transcript_2489/m.5464 type:complete len:270 (-) Transcript_2489:768-1577(-)
MRWETVRGGGGGDPCVLGPPLFYESLEQLPVDQDLARLTEVLVQVLAEYLRLDLALDVHGPVVCEQLHVPRAGVEARGRFPEVLAAVVQVPPGQRVLVDRALVRVRDQVCEDVLDPLALLLGDGETVHETLRRGGPRRCQLRQHDSPRLQHLQLLRKAPLQEVHVLLSCEPVLHYEADDDHGEGGQEGAEVWEYLAGLEVAEVLLHDQHRQQQSQGPVDAVQQVGRIVVLVENDVDQLEYHSIQYGHGELQAYGSEVQFEPLVRVLHSV